MSKKLSEGYLKKCFEFDFDSILLSDSSNDEKPAIENNKSKRFKKDGDVRYLNNSSKAIKEDSVAVKKEILMKFTLKVTELLQEKIGEMIRKQEKEMEEFKKGFATEVDKELDDWEKNLLQIKRLEEKLLQVFEQLRTVYSVSELQSKKVETIAEMHRNFIQKYQELMKKHKTEAMALKDDLKRNILRLKTEILSDSTLKRCSTLTIGK